MERELRCSNSAVRLVLVFFYLVEGGCGWKASVGGLNHLQRSRGLGCIEGFFHYILDIVCKSEKRSRNQWLGIFRVQPDIFWPVNPHKIESWPLWECTFSHFLLLNLQDLSVISNSFVKYFKSFTCFFTNIIPCLMSLP